MEPKIRNLDSRPVVLYLDMLNDHRYPSLDWRLHFKKARNFWTSSSETEKAILAADTSDSNSRICSSLRRLKRQMSPNCRMQQIYVNIFFLYFLLNSAYQRHMAGHEQELSIAHWRQGIGIAVPNFCWRWMRQQKGRFHSLLLHR